MSLLHPTTNLIVEIARAASNKKIVYHEGSWEDSEVHVNFGKFDTADDVYNSIICYFEEASVFQDVDYKEDESDIESEFEGESSSSTMLVYRYAWRGDKPKHGTFYIYNVSQQEIEQLKLRLLQYIQSLSC